MPVNIEKGVTITSGVTISIPPPPPFTAFYEPGRGANLTVTFPAAGNGNITINWGDGNTESFDGNFRNGTNPPTHTYSSNANYTVTATGTLYGIQTWNSANNAGEPRLTGISSWGNLGIQELSNGFRLATNLTVVPNSLPITLTSNNLTNLFRSCSFFNDSNVINWNVSNITDFGDLFRLANVFNQNIGNWNTGNVTDMSFMFSRNQNFNQNIASWDTSNVSNMAYMFGTDSIGTTAFNQNIANWNVSNVSNMKGMFFSQSSIGSFNQDISSWNTSNVADMSEMFTFTVFDQNIGSWDTSNVANMARMFQATRDFNGNIENWNVGNVTNMSNMFSKTAGAFVGNMTFNKNIGNWDVQKVTTMAFMFSISDSFNGNIGSWGNKTSNVANMNSMFSDAGAFDQNLASWCVTLIPTKPTNFDLNADAWTGGNATRPDWGNCP